MTPARHSLAPAGIAVLAFVLGALLAVVTTFTHRQLPPWGLLAGVLILGALLVGTRLAVPGRLAAGSAAFGVIGVIAVLSLQTAGGSVLVANDLLGMLWAAAPTLLAVVVVAWPAPRTRAATAPAAASDTE